MRTHPTQTAYLIAKGRCDAAIKAKNAHDRIFESAYDATVDMEQEFNPSHFEDFYQKWHAENPDKAAERDRLGALERAAKDALRRAEDAMLAWGMPLLLTAAKTEKEREYVRAVCDSKSIVVRSKGLAALSQMNHW